MMKRYFVLINLALATVAIYFGVAAFYKYETGKLAVGPEAGVNGQKAQAIGPARSLPLSAYKAIETRNLFDVRINEPTPAPKEAPQKVQEAVVRGFFRRQQVFLCPNVPLLPSHKACICTAGS